jgi:hypothetical protein
MPTAHCKLAKTPVTLKDYFIKLVLHVYCTPISLWHFYFIRRPVQATGE